MPSESGSSAQSTGLAGETGNGPSIPDHRLIRKIGIGSYGEVWLAQCALGALRAIKIIHRDKFHESRPYEREFAGICKYEPVSREHEGLVDVLQVGGSGKDGLFYYVMELADDLSGAIVPNPTAVEQGQSPTPIPGSAGSVGAGDSLASYQPHTLGHDLNSRAPLPVTEVVELGLRLARALGFLHSKGLAHRDLKPSNIIFIGGEPKLADVGTVARLDDSLSYVGTPGYMPPEGPGTITADIYSLGKILYEAVTGMNREDFPDLPPALLTGSESERFLELNEVLQKACDSNPAHRYQTAARMVEDLKCLAEGHSLRRARLRCQRRRRLVAAVGVILAVASLIGLGLALHRFGVPGLGPKVLFSDEFQGGWINTNLWVTGTKEWPGLENTGRRQFRIEQTNGELVVEARARHERGLTTFGAAWVDTCGDLRALGDCWLELEASGTNVEGTLSLCIADGSPPILPYGSGCVTLLSEAGLWDYNRVRVEILHHQQAAVVYPDAMMNDSFSVFDLSGLKEWRLRFLALANSSDQRENGLARFMVRKITAVKEPDSRTVIGHVVNGLTGRPVGGAIVSDDSGLRLARSRDNGAYILTARDKPMRIRVKHPEFATSPEMTIAARQVRSQPLVTALFKETYLFGDVTEVIRCPNYRVHAVGFRGTNLWILGQENDSAYFIAPVDVAAKRVLRPGIRLGPHRQGFCGLVECNGRLLAPSTWPGRIFDLTSGKPVVFMSRIPRQDGASIEWPWKAVFDGNLLWLLERDHLTTNGVGLHGLDLTSGSVKHWLISRDRALEGLAWDETRQCFWISTTTGRVFSVDRDAALKAGNLDAGRGREFSGNYFSLAFAYGSLWGVNDEHNQICRIKTTD